MKESAYKAYIKTRKHQQGVGLIEILITLLVLGIGLIGIASLQLHALQANQSAYLRSQAVNLSYDILDRLRVNNEVATNHNTYDTNTALDLRFANGFTLIGNCNMNLAYNNNLSLADNDINAWINSLRCSLPQGHGSITRDANNSYSITIRWSSMNLEGSDDVDNDWESFTTRTRL